jgi:hypothetical protein
LDDDLDDDLANDLDSALSATEVLGIKIPLTYKEAINDLEHGEQWREAIIEELRSLIGNGTWKEVVPPKGANIITSKWVFTIKTLTMGVIDQFKARMVARGFTQIYGVDYERSKYIDICYHFTRDLNEKGKLKVAYIPTNEMPADGFTKPLQKPGFLRFKGLLGLVD